MERLNEFLNQYKLPLSLSVVGLVLIVGGVASSGLFTKPSSYPARSLIKEVGSSVIKVDISGAVRKPGVYSLKTGDRAEEAIKAAGSFTETANQDFISKRLNLSQKLTDGQKIYIPFEGDSAPAGIGQGQSGVVSGVETGKISLNTSTQSQLESLPAVGAATALKIIAGRPYATVEELLTKKVISRSVFEKIKDLVDVN